MNRLALFCLCASLSACDVLPKLQLQLQQDIQDQYHVTHAMAMVVDTTNLVVAIFDDARAGLEASARESFKQEVAQYAVTHFHKAKLSGVAVVVGRASRRGTQPDDQPTMWVPEYHPDGSVRLASFRRASPSAQPKPQR